MQRNELYCPGVHLGMGGGGHSPPLDQISPPPLEIASLQSASHVHRASPPLFFINTNFAQHHIPYSGKFSRGNIFVDFVVSTKPHIFLSMNFDIIAI